MGRLAILLLLLLGCAPPETPRGTWSGTWKDRLVEAEWSPASPRIGDHVRLRLRFPGGAPEPRLLGGLPPALLSSPGTLEYRHLVKRPGPFRPAGFSTSLWTVPEEPKGPWIHLRTRAVFTPLPWPVWIWAFGVIPLGALGSLLWRFLSLRPPVLSRRKWAGALRSGSPEKLKESYSRMRRMWERSGAKAETPEDHSFLSRMNRVLFGATLPPVEELKGDLDFLRKRIGRKRSV